uniref:Odorant receptor n=1 Tax=Cacopsylla melanoneura TaxID=428564 RepID=A0A8D8TL39_9HEMI
MSLVRNVKLIMQCCAVMAQFYFLFDTSEMTDDCHAVMRHALLQSGWVKSSSPARRDICILLRRIQVSNHFTFHNGAIRPGRVLFLKVMKTAYSFVNFMRFENKAD